MPAKIICARCGENRFQSASDPTLCNKCVHEQSEQAVAFKLPPISQEALSARQAGTKKEAYQSMFRLAERKCDAFALGELTDVKHSYEVHQCIDQTWLSSALRVFKDYFICSPDSPLVFEGLVVLKGEEMMFSPPRRGSKNAHDLPSPTITISPYATWCANSERGSRRDWSCVLCHEIIHYLHWRWTILPCGDEHYSDYEERVGGRPTVVKIPYFDEKEQNGMRELKSPPATFTENGFRAMLKLTERAYYGDTTVFAAKDV
ncbi:MAG TPA: hypothetical protein VI299_03140 [Polyangiales bacterium]